MLSGFLIHQLMRKHVRESVLMELALKKFALLPVPVQILYIQMLVKAVVKLMDYAHFLFIKYKQFARRKVEFGCLRLLGFGRQIHGPILV